MATNTAPPGNHTITPYLVVPGVPALIDFLKAVFGAAELERIARPDGTVMHAEVRIGDSLVMMAEATGEHSPMPAMLYVYVDDVDAAFGRAVAAGATSLREPSDQFYGDRKGGVADAFGNQWWIATRKENVSPEEIARRAAEATG